MLLIVESPAKAKKIQTFFKDGTIVLSSCGHINNLAKKNMGIDIDNNFQPTYEYLPDKKDIIKTLKSKAKSKQIILAADDDREGDAIAWHCGNLLKVDYEQKNRIVFREINQKSIQKSMNNIHKINMNSVYSQQARQIIDKLIGFKLSPLLWENIQTDQKGLSAGRVQSTLLLLLKSLEENINNFESTSDYIFSGNFAFNEKQIVPCIFHPREDFSYTEENIQKIFKILQKKKLFKINHLKEKKVNDYPPKPFITTTLQQTAYNTHGFSIKHTMSIAQKLFDNGKITYMRTDSTFISDEFKRTLETHINDTYNDEHNSYYYDPKDKMKKVKGAQEAHECIRVTDINYKLNDKYTEEDHKIYNLIKKRTIMSHMKPAIYNQMELSLANKQVDGLFIGKHKNLIFDGYLKYNNVPLSDRLNINSKNVFILQDAECKENYSNPPGYYNESSLVKKLESSGIGRPSTYASIVSTLYNRNYTIVKNIDPYEKHITVYSLDDKNDINQQKSYQKISMQKNKILLTPLGYQVLNYLLQHFDNIINVQFTSLVESDLDEISEGNLIWQDVVQKVYNSFYQKVDKLLKNKPFQEKILGKHKNKKVILRKGPYGPYLNYQKKNIGLTNHIRYKNLSLETISLEDVIQLLS